MYPYEKDKNADPVVIYGSGESANILLNALQGDSSKNVVAIYDDSEVFKNLQINNIPIISSFKKLISSRTAFTHILGQRNQRSLQNIG